MEQIVKRKYKPYRLKTYKAASDSYPYLRMTIPREIVDALGLTIHDEFIISYDIGEKKIIYQKIENGDNRMTWIKDASSDNLLKILNRAETRVQEINSKLKSREYDMNYYQQELKVLSFKIEKIEAEIIERDRRL